MKASIAVGRIRFELDAQDQPDLARQIASLQEVFGETQCGHADCLSENIMWRVRTVGEDEYFENVCKDCGASLSFGQAKKKKGTMFPIRKITAEGKASRKEGTFDKVNKGWKRWKGKPEVDAEE